MLFTDEINNLASNIVKFSSEFKHINMDNILILGKFDRGNSGGTIAICNCIKLKGSKNNLDLRYYNKKIKYFIEFSFPRFLTLSPFDKIKTIIHELLHISEKFDGSLRIMRHGKKYENEVTKISEKYLEKFGYCSTLTKNYDKIKFKKWNKKPRFSITKTFFDEQDIRISICDINKFQSRFKFVYTCPICNKEYYLKKKAKEPNFYYCVNCVKRKQALYSSSNALVLTKMRA